MLKTMLEESPDRLRKEEAKKEIIRSLIDYKGNNPEVNLEVEKLVDVFSKQPLLESQLF